MRKRPLRLIAKIMLLVSVVVALSLSVTAMGMSYYIEKIIQDNLGNSTMNIARSVANNASVVDAMDVRDTQHLQEMAERIRSTTGVRYVVIFDHEGYRLSHPNPSEIGLPIVGGDEGPALAGKEYISLARGTLGDSLRAFTPIYNNQGQLLGGVVVGILIESIDKAIWESRKILLFVMCFGLITGCVGSYFLAKNIKSGLFGLEPDEIARIYEERNAVLQGIKEGVIVINAAGDVVLLNEASRKMLNIQSPRGYIGKPVEDVIPNTRLHEVLQSGRPEYDQVQQINEVSIVTNRIPVLVRGKVVGALATFRDMTEVKNLADELSDIKTYTEALRSQAHEFMNKLHVLWGLTQLKCYDEVSAYIASIVSTAETEAQFVVNRIKNPAVAGLLLAKYSKAREVAAKLVLEPDSALPNELFISNADMITILGNLIDNAIDAIRYQKEREIHVFVRGDKDQLKIAVSDSGPGVEEPIRQQIFDWGFSTKGGQRGVGLFLVQQAVRKYQGSITCENLPAGCRFEINCVREQEG